MIETSIKDDTTPALIPHINKRVGARWYERPKRVPEGIQPPAE